MLMRTIALDMPEAKVAVSDDQGSRRKPGSGWRQRAGSARAVESAVGLAI